MRQHLGPGPGMAGPRLLIWKALMRESQAGCTVVRLELNPPHRLGATSGGGYPCEFDRPIVVQTEEASVVRMPLPLEVRLEIEGGVNLAFHQYRARHSEPTIELFCPCAEQHAGRRSHRALRSQPERPG